MNPSEHPLPKLKTSANKDELKPTAEVAHHARPPNSPKISTSNDWLTLLYDIGMLVIIVADLILIGADLVLMHPLSMQFSEWLGATDSLIYYTEYLHPTVRSYGGFITVFLVLELLVRWLLAIINKQYMRWFFFPFIRWYEVLGCFPQLRALRLLRAIVIVRRLHLLGYRILPKKWIKAGQFYYGLVLEELADRVILTATDNLRQQFSTKNTSQQLINDTVTKNRVQITTMISSMLHQELQPKLARLAHGDINKVLSNHIGASVQEALANTIELQRYLHFIPLAGEFIESQVHTIGHQVAENLVSALSKRLIQPDLINPLIDTLAASIANIDLTNSELETLITDIVEDILTAFEQQVKVQQWKHQQYLHAD